MYTLHMPLQVKVRRLPEFTSVKVSGPATLADFVAFIAEFGAESHRHGDKRVLVDLLEVQNQFKFTDHFRIGEAAARELRHLERLASVVPASQLTRTSEKVAVRQGLQLRVFVSMSEAIRWLQEPAAPG
ncbi:MAG TPA: STAS/SEC14 domain-containing protein [Ramlibacter sp.]|nr:STAS/SEC14 domain-containing protein [Ramlibacter sp.]